MSSIVCDTNSVNESKKNLIENLLLDIQKSGMVFILQYWICNETFVIYIQIIPFNSAFGDKSKLEEEVKKRREYPAKVWYNHFFDTKRERPKDYKVFVNEVPPCFCHEDETLFATSATLQRITFNEVSVSIMEVRLLYNDTGYALDYEKMDRCAAEGAISRQIYNSVFNLNIEEEDRSYYGNEQDMKGIFSGQRKLKGFSDFGVIRCQKGGKKYLSHITITKKWLIIPYAEQVSLLQKILSNVQ